MVYESTNKATKILFEPDLQEELEDRGYIKAKDKCNTRYFKDGYFSKYIFLKDFCRAATDLEIKEYIEAKHSMTKEFCNNKSPRKNHN